MDEKTPSDQCASPQWPCLTLNHSWGGSGEEAQAPRARVPMWHPWVWGEWALTLGCFELDTAEGFGHSAGARARDGHISVTLR